MSLLGLARRAGAVEPGIDRTRSAVRSGRARLVVMASDGAPGQRAKVESLVRHTSIPVIVMGDGAELGAAVGTAALSALAVTDASFADAIRACTPTEETHAGI